MAKLGLPARGHLHPGRPARPPRGAAVSAIALAGAGLERFATEIRHLQRTEVREVEEPFREGQKGSSAMPHKRNPVVCERICGLARVLRGNAQVGLENVALWHERDITHSCAERIVLPDSTILLDQVLALDAAGRARDDGPRRPDAGQPRDHVAARCSPSACCWRWSRPGCSATTRTGSSSGSASRPGTRRRRCARCWSSENVEIDLDEVFDYGYYVRHVPRCWRAWR